ncbi:LssY C-terminal domain-containing protein [Actinomyces vulturis]|uniref:LssY C-terminal domain-containing protein n=1 Tax=Actinomyces vulturis TaxID=1857645 RepID=UPI001FE08070|nr:LssY C-terminal domain-containing protein [Actinomyces vulturis]
MRKELRIDGTNRYPIPTSPPRYESEPKKVSGEKAHSVADFFEFSCVVTASVLTLWLAWLLVQKSSHWAWSSLGWLIAFWALMAYLALPRLHQFFTALYVPDYFIARTRTGDGLLGDPVNLAVDGDEVDIHIAMRRAGWVLADEITLRSSWGIIKSSVLRRSYPQAPVSSLFLLGNRHNFAYQQEVDGNASQRHHIRFWKTPEGWMLPGGHQVGWLAAGTYDRAVGLSLFTGQITHKIDADIDDERDFVINTVRYADPQCDVQIIEDFSTAYHHRNGGGDSVHTDGDLPVLDVTAASQRDLPGDENIDRPQDVRVSDSLSGGSLSVADQMSAAANHHLPPTPFLLAGAMIVLSVVSVAIAWLLLAGHGWSWHGEDTSLSVEFIGLSVGVLLMLVLWVLTAARRRWARIALMLMTIVGSIQDLGLATVRGSISTSGLISAGISVLMLWAISSDAMRQWVKPSSR